MKLEFPRNAGLHDYLLALYYRIPKPKRQ